MVRGRSLVFLLGLLLPGFAQEKKPEDPMSYDRSVRPLFQNFCHGCHDAEKKKGDIDLTEYQNVRQISQDRKTWQTVLDMIERKEMPPKKAEKHPRDEQRKQMVDFIRKTLDALDCTTPGRNPGKPVTRRLNRSEYDNSIRELIGLDLHLADGFSPDPTGYAFDNIAEALAISPVLVEQYHAAARKLLGELVEGKEAYRRVFFITGGDRAVAKQILERFALKAFRRPADPAFVDRLLKIYDKARSKGEGHAAAVRPMLLGVLISPRFLLRIETARPKVQGAYPVEDYDLASRLSFFLWSGPPDDELLGLAAQGALGSPEILEAQARRMLADPRSRALADNFFGQWLQLRGLAAHEPDKKRFPEFTGSLRNAMKEELDRFLGEIIQKDRPVTDLLDGDYTYVNEELARHYGLPAVSGSEMRRVTLPDRRRGGIVTTAAVLMLQADPDRNNIPRRGNYVASWILGSPPPPPPPEVPALEETKGGGKDLPLRKRLELHRSKAECAGCHARIDPLGFGLENFDAIGRWRDREEGAEIDASGVMPDGKSFKGPVELKKILLGRRDDFTRTMAEHMLIYAMGRGLEREDECVVRDTLKAAAEGGYRFSTLVLTIVRSHPFRHRRNPDF